jgi:hypothetical protein
MAETKKTEKSIEEKKVDGLNFVGGAIVTMIVLKIVEMLITHAYYVAG